MKNLNKCSYCGTSYEEIMQTGFVGCENCYKEIDELQKQLASLYADKKHRGKTAGSGNGSF